MVIKNKFLMLLIIVVTTLLSAGTVSAAKTITSNATGGDCTLIGTWVFDTNTCTLNTDVTAETITVSSNGITLDCDSHTLTGSGFTIGVSVQASGVTVKNCNIDDHKSDGILVQNSYHCTIQNNTIDVSSGNGLYGIRLISSDINLISGNVIGANMTPAVAKGIGLLGSNGNTVKDNTVYSPAGATALQFSAFAGSQSDNNLIYNNFINTSTINQFFLDGVHTNTWNVASTPGTNIIGGPNLGGNYWADPSGTGFSETCTADADGFCDTAFELDPLNPGSNVDNLPLTSAVVDPFSLKVNEDLIPRTKEVTGRGGIKRRVVTYRDQHGVATDFVEDEVLIRPLEEGELDDFLIKYGGEIIGDNRVPEPPPGLSDPIWDPNSPDVLPNRYLVRVDLSSVPVEYLDNKGNVIGMEGEFDFSSPEAVKLIALTTHERLSGLKVSPNFVSAPQSGFFIDTTEGKIDEENVLNAFDLDEFNGPYDVNGHPFGWQSTVTAAWQLIFSKLMSTDPEIDRVPVVIIDCGFWLDKNGKAYAGDTGTDFETSYPVHQYDFNSDDYTAGGKEGCHEDSPWHGNAVAGAATGLIDNGGGAAGTGGSMPGGQVSIPVLYKASTYDAHMNAISAVTHLTEKSVVNLSIIYICNEDCSGYMSEMQSEINDATVLGHIFVAAAGNYGDVADHKYYPCTLQNVICVGALGNHGKFADSASNYGDFVDIWAPGTVKVMADPDNPNPHDVSGTSIASPFIAGIVAMMKSVNSSLTHAEVLGILRGTAYKDSIDWKLKFSGYVNAVKAVARAMELRLPPDILEQNNNPLDPGSLYTYSLNVGGHDSDSYLIEVGDYSSLDFRVFNMALGLGDIVYSLTPHVDNTYCEEPINVNSTHYADGSDFEADLLFPGKYWVGLRSHFPQHYHMTYTLDPTSISLEEDNLEPNNSFLEAHQNQGLIDYNVSYNATLHENSDVDYYEFSTDTPFIFSLGVQAICSSSPLTIELYLKEYPLCSGQLCIYPPPERIKTIQGTSVTFSTDADLAHGETYFVKISGLKTRYRFWTDIDIQVLDPIEEYFWWIDPGGPVQSVLEDISQWFIAKTYDIQNGSLLLVGRGMQMTVFNTDLDVLAIGLPSNQMNSQFSAQLDSVSEANQTGALKTKGSHSKSKKGKNTLWATLDQSLDPEAWVLIKISRKDAVNRIEDLEPIKYSLHIVGKGK
jgi:parallel beta-helix repeat protein